MAAFCLPLECVWWRLSTGSGMWEAGSQSNGCCCGQVVAAISLLCMADILLQWAVSTHRHFIHMGQQAGLLTPHIYPISHEYHKQSFLFLFIQSFLLYFEAQPDSLSISGKIPVRKFFMAYMEPRSVSRQHMVSQREHARLVYKEHAWTYYQEQSKTLRNPYFKQFLLKFDFKLHSILEPIKRTKFNESDKIFHTPSIMKTQMFQWEWTVFLLQLKLINNSQSS